MLFKNTTELKARMGFLFASLNFENLKTDLELASKEMRRMIGPGIYDAAQAFYDENSTIYNNLPDTATLYQVAMSELVKLIQLPIGLNAYLAYSPNSDLTHSEKGRQIFVSEEEKPAFEWQLNRDEEATRNRMERSIEELLTWLEENTQELTTIAGDDEFSFAEGQYYTGFELLIFCKDDFSATINSRDDLIRLLHADILQPVLIGDLPTEWDDRYNYQKGDLTLYENQVWISAENDNEDDIPNIRDSAWVLCLNNPAFISAYKTTDAWQQNNKLVVNRIELFERAFPIDRSYRLFKALEPFRAESERRTIRPLVGSANIDALLLRRRTGQLTDADQELIDFIVPIVAFQAMIKGVSRLSVTLLPSGILSQFATGTNNTRSKTDATQRLQVAKSLLDNVTTEIAALQMYLAHEAGGDSWEPPSVMPENSTDNQFFAV